MIRTSVARAKRKHHRRSKRRRPPRKRCQRHQLPASQLPRIPLQRRHQKPVAKLLLQRVIRKSAQKRQTPRTLSQPAKLSQQQRPLRPARPPTRLQLLKHQLPKHQPLKHQLLKHQLPKHQLPKPTPICPASRPTKRPRLRRSPQRPSLRNRLPRSKRKSLRASVVAAGWSVCSNRLKANGCSQVSSVRFKL